MSDYSDTRIQFRRGTAAQWSAANPVILSSGEPGFITDTNTLKIGDGTTAFASLSAITGGGGGSEVNDLSSVVTWANVPDANITESSVVQHSGALQITESQITDFGTYLTAVSDDTSPSLGAELNLNNNDIVVDCKNDSGETLFAGTPVFISGYYSANGKYLIAGARADDPARMPAVGLINTNIAKGAEGTVGILGVASNINTNSFNVGDVLYVHPTGGMTTVRPSGIDHKVQNIGKVLRKDASNGRIAIVNAGRSNDIPNSGNFQKLCVNNSPVVVSDTTGITNASGISNIVYMTQAAYDALGSYNATTLYYIV